MVPAGSNQTRLNGGTGNSIESPLIIAFVFGIGLLGTFIFWPAGTMDWFLGWAYVGVVTANLLGLLLYVRNVNPGLIEQRRHIGKGTKTWDKVLMVILAPVFLSIYVVAGFDAIRFEWTSMSGALWPFGLALLVPGTVLYGWSMGVNPFFEKTVRIQTERNHRVIDTGPYAFVRHPGYLGFFGWCLSAPLLLGSWWAFVPGLSAVLGLVIRTALEDRTLRVELAGYNVYARRVRYRLIPGVW